MHPLLTAAKLTVTDLGGTDLAARHIGKSASSLYSELDPNNRHAKLGLLDAALLASACQDKRLASAFAMECGGLFLPLPQTDGSAAADDISRHFARLATEFGDVLSAAGAAVIGGNVTDTKLTAVQVQGLELMGALQALMVHLAQCNQAAKGPNLQAGA